MDHGRYFDDNLANWNDRVPIHAGSDGYGLDEYRTDPERLSTIVAFDRRMVGDVAGKSLLHLQCHIGTDTISWAKLGASVTGLDFSAPALAVARDLASDMGLDATFVESDVYGAPDVLDEHFDIVYTGVGAICWLPDIVRWADVVARLTRPGGMFFMREGHPILWAADWEAETQDGSTDESIRITYPYFETEAPNTFDEPETYLGTGTLEHSVHHDWNHGLGEIFTALLGAGFRIDAFEEHRFLEWKALPQMEERDGVWVLPDHQRDLLPLMYSLQATRLG